jgi:hypothetical protein
MPQKQSLTQIYETFRRENARGEDGAADETAVPITEPARLGGTASVTEVTVEGAGPGPITKKRSPAMPAKKTANAKRAVKRAPARKTAPEPAADSKENTEERA